MEAPVFLLVSGARRSGTTAFAHALNSHPQVGILHEYGPDRLADHVLAFFDRWDEQFITANGSIPQLPGGGPGTFPLPNRTRDFERILLGVYAAVFPDKHLRVIGDKTPTFLNDAGFQRLRYQLPRVKLVYLLRNPIDVVYSSLRRAQLAARGVDVWDIKRVSDACREWLSDCHELQRVRTQSLCDTLVLKYEDFTPERAPAQWERVAAFLGVPNEFVPSVEAKPQSSPTAMPETWSRYARYCFESISDSWQDEDVDTLLTRALAIQLPLRENQIVSFGDGMSGGAYLKEGFAAPEHDGAWTTDRQAHLVFRAVTTSETACLEIDFSSRVSGSRRRMRFIVGVNGEQTGFDVSPFSWDEIFRIQVTLNQHALRDGGTVHVRFEILDPKQRDEEPAGDPRALGIYLRRMKLYGASIVGSLNLGFDMGPEGAQREVVEDVKDPATVLAAENGLETSVAGEAAACADPDPATLRVDFPNGAPAAAMTTADGAALTSDDQGSDLATAHHAALDALDALGKATDRAEVLSSQ